jgi:hypothetical protein
MKNLIKALIEFQDKVPAIELNSEVEIKGKSKTGKDYKLKFKYADLPYIIKTIKPVLKECGLVFSHVMQGDKVGCMLYHQDGDHIESWMTIPINGDMKNNGANITYARRYTLTSVLGICAEEDKDMGENKKRPLLGAKQFSLAKARIEQGEEGVLKQALLHFSLTDQQLEELQNISVTHGG